MALENHAVDLPFWKGLVTGLEIYQPNGVFEAKRVKD